MGRGGGAVQRVGIGQPLGLGVQVEVLAVGRLGSLDLLKPAPQVRRLPGALAGQGGQVVEPALILRCRW